MSKSVLAVLSEWGFWGEELVGPLESLDKAGYETVFATPKGKRPPALPPSMDSSYVDPPLGRPVVSVEMAKKTLEIDKSSRLDNPINLSELLPERPYMSVDNYLAKLEEYFHALEDAERKLEKYAALLLVGGSGPIVDMVNNQRLHDLILAFVKQDKPVAAECYGVTCLAFARDFLIRYADRLMFARDNKGNALQTFLPLLNLPDDVTEKLYYRNALRLVPLPQ